MVRRDTPQKGKATDRDESDDSVHIIPHDKPSHPMPSSPEDHLGSVGQGR